MKRIVTYLLAAAVLAVAGLAVAAVCATSAQLDTDLTGATLGQTISLSGVTPLDCPDVLTVGTWSAGRLVFSDSPESPTAKGTLYEDANLPATSGTAYHRAFVYHVNNRSKTTSRFTVLITNTSASSGTLTVQKKGTAGPTTSFAYAGKLAFQRWLDSTAGSGVTIAAGGVARLDSTFDTTNVSVGSLLHGIWDYSFTQTHKIEVCILDTGDSPTGVCPGLSVLARDTHDRGTFDSADKIYDTATSETIDAAEDCQSFTIGCGTGANCTDGDEAITGWDNAVASPTAETLDGNFGVLYRMHLAMTETDGRNIGLLVNPRGGGWGGAARVMAGILPAVNTTFLVPPGSGTTSDNTKGSVLGRWDPTGGVTVWVQFMPTGGSAFPVRVVAVPH
jgi:hypothetical protein